MPWNSADEPVEHSAKAGLLLCATALYVVAEDWADELWNPKQNGGATLHDEGKRVEISSIAKIAINKWKG